ncbi:response regulator receiver and ANTAR domain protein [Kushneria sinocarnis]|uniref:Response regulator receiver and ANTAR domain protein n=1 Tax=Kushneria sinocarnis TaxID=595502 RepID=A0A420WZ37_9GAMM|nr:ANTAR domain-containing protein [Kushneria sinocarnis]RKR06606.1 response regulator receiver and ANTAR domain protein [Kushneria sinocarnis]
MSARVLIVDARSERSQALEQALREAGFDVVMTIGEQEDLYAAVEQLEPDAVLIDAASPSRDSLEHLGQLGKRYPRPMIMLTSQDSPELTRDAARAGVSAYVVESLMPPLMRSMIDVAIASFEQHNALREELTRTRRSMTERKAVDRAKTLLMERRRLSENNAYQYLRKLAMDRRMNMSELAEELINAADERRR